MKNQISEGLIETLLKKLETMSSAMEKASVAEFIELYHHPWRLMYLNFIGGIVRGFGLAVGFTVVGAAFLFFLGRLAALNLPIVGEFVAEIARIVQEELANRPL